MVFIVVNTSVKLGTMVRIHIGSDSSIRKTIMPQFGLHATNIVSRQSPLGFEEEGSG